MNYVEFYVVRIGPENRKLYLDSSVYGFYQSTTVDILRAKKYTDFFEAEKVAKARHGEVEGYKIVPMECDETDEKEELKNIIIELNKKLKLSKGGNNEQRK